MSENIPEFLESDFLLNGDFETLAENLLDNLQQRMNWGITYVETYTNSDSHAVYLISGVHIRNRSSNEDAILSFTVKIIEAQNAQSEIWVTSSLVNTNGFPMRQLTQMFSSKTVEVDSLHSDEHLKLLDQIGDFCLQGYGQGLVLGDIFRKLLRSFNREKAKRH